jgi:hypothetical protein
MKTFRDINREANETFNVNYFYSKSFSLGIQNESGMHVSFDGDVSAKEGCMSSVALSRRSSYFSVNNISMDSDGVINGSVAMKTSPITKCKLSVQDGRHAVGKNMKSSVNLGYEIDLPTAHVTTNIDMLSGPHFNTSALLSLNKSVKVGFDSSINTNLEEPGKVPELSQLNLGIGMRAPSWIAGMKTSSLFKKISGTYLQRPSGKLDVVMRVDHSFAENKQTFEIGSKYVIDKQSQIKSKLQSDGQAAISFTQNLSDMISMTLCAKFSITDDKIENNAFGIGFDINI